MSEAGWIFVIGATPLAAYALLNILTPGTTIRWQHKSTERSRRRGSEWGAAVGSGFASLAGATGAEPWDDPAVRRRVRWIGVAEILLAAVFIGLGVSLA